MESRAVCARLEELPFVRAADTVVAYHPLPSELDVTGYVEARWATRRAVALPRVAGESLMLHEWGPQDDLQRNALGVLEPAAFSRSAELARVGIILVPGLGFDRQGHRLGFGRGFYDRLLSRFATRARVGVAFDVQVVDRLPREPHDVKLGYLVTPSAVLDFNEGQD